MRIASLLCVSSLALSAGAFAESTALRLLPGSAFRPAPCEGPCLCANPGPTIPAIGRMYLADAASIPEVRAWSASARVHAEMTGAQTHEVRASGHYVIHFMEVVPTHKLMLAGTVNELPGVEFDSGTVVQPAPFPSVTIAARSQLFACTRYYLTVHATQTCVTDYDDGSGRGNPDGGVSLDDLLYYLDLYQAGDPQSDLDDGSGIGQPDAGVTLDDLLFYLTHYAAGC